MKKKKSIALKHTRWAKAKDIPKYRILHHAVFQFILSLDYKKRVNPKIWRVHISKVCVRPSCSSDILPIDGEDSDASIQTESGKASTANNATKENLDENSTDQSRSALPCRSKRSNAGTLMYAILENSKSPATVNRSSKRKGTRLETSQTLDGVCEAEVHNPVVKSNISQASENQNLAVEGPTKTCSNDEGSDVSNKENDETNVSCKTRSQLLDDGPREMKNVETRTTRRKDVGPNEVKPVETRTTRRKNLTNDLSEDLNKSAINNNVTRGRFEDVSLKCKNNRDAPKCFSEEMPGKVGIDVENKRRSTSVSIRHSSRKGVTPLYLRNAELEKGSCVNTSKDSSATNSLLDKPKFSEATCKSMESLHMDKENMTVPPTTCGKSTTVDHCLNSSSQRRLSCPDIFETRETETIKIASHEKVSFSTQQEESSAVNSDFELHEDARRGDSQVNKTVADPGNNEKTNRRSGRLIGSTGHQDSLTIKDHGNGNRVSRHVRKFYHKLSKTETEISSTKKHEDLDPSNKTHTMCASKDSVNPSEDHTLIIPDLQHPSTITINIHSSVDKIVEDEPPQVTLFFDDSAVATFNSKDVQLKEHAVDDLSQIEYNIDSAEPSCLAAKKSERSAKNSPLEELGRADSLLEDSCSSEFKGFSQEQPDATAQDSLEKEYKGFTDDEIQEATVKLRLLKQYIANKLQSQPADNLLDQIDGPPRIKKARVASEDVVSSNISKSSTDSTARQNPRKRNCSLNFSPEKDKKEVLGGQCKAESKDSGLCESPEQPSFVLDVYQNDAVMESGENSVRTRKKGNVPPATSTIGCTKNLRDDKCSDLRPKGYSKIRNPQRYSTNDLYKPRPVVSRDTRTSRSAPATSRGRPKRST
uniref:Uncharacterized protein n=1 Tax=Lygus hesperus TaxID=30085 RepID=A0A0A9Y7Z1_LYGHE